MFFPCPTCTTLAPIVLPDRLIILLKAPRPGWVKTRLAAALGPEGAVAAYRQLVDVLRQNLAAWPGVELRHAPDNAGAELAEWLQPGWSLAPQGDGDLGERLTRTFAEHFARGARRVVVIGADCPEVTREDITAALDALDGGDVVLGPALDGGYWLVGLRAPRPELFEGIDWSTSEVMAQTEAKALAAGLQVARLRTLSDIDTLDDWHRWRA